MSEEERVARGGLSGSPQTEREVSASAPDIDGAGGGGFLNSDLGKQVGAFVTHLEELRTRLIRAMIGIVAGMVVCLIFAEKLVNLLIRTAGKPEEIKFSLLTPTEGILVYLKVGLVAGLFLSAPYWFAQVWGFISPALYKNEKKVIAPIIASSAGAFLIGAGFGYYLLPFTAEYFRSFSGPQIENVWSLSSYVNMALQFMLAFGVVFELPLVLYALALLGLVTPKTLRHYRRHSIIGILIVAGVITPGPDVFSQVVVALPLIILYEVGIILTAFAQKPKLSVQA